MARRDGAAAFDGRTRKRRKRVGTKKRSRDAKRLKNRDKE